MLVEAHQCCAGCLPSCRQQPQELALEAYEAAGVGSHHLTQGLRMGTNANQGLGGCSMSSGPPIKQLIWLFAAWRRACSRSLLEAGLVPGSLPVEYLRTAGICRMGSKAVSHLQA